jgi:CheY-like chemotaxis protein
MKEFTASTIKLTENQCDTLRWLSMSHGVLLLTEVVRQLNNFDSLSVDDARHTLELLAEAEEYILGLFKTNDQTNQHTYPSKTGQIDLVNKRGSSDVARSINGGRKAPVGYETILVADDDGYPLESISLLEHLGYHVEVVTGFTDAEATIAADPMAVLLCDQTFGSDPMAGRQLMALARREGSWKLIVALSGSNIDLSEVPEADGVCSGARAKLADGARRLHEMICEWATSHP